MLSRKTPSRARFEAEAYRSNLEMHFWRYGTTTRSRPLAELLHDYGCRPDDVEPLKYRSMQPCTSIRLAPVFTRVCHRWVMDSWPCSSTAFVQSSV